MIKVPGFRQEETILQPNTITGNMVFESNPNDVQKVYMESIPAVVKIITYVDFDRYLPNIEYIDWSDYNRKIDWGQEPSYYDLDIDYDRNTNYYDLLEDELGQEYGADVEDFPYSVGSGFIINPDGYVLTNAHVLAISEEETKEVLRNFYMGMLYYTMEELYATDPEYTADYYLEDWALLNFMDEKLEIRNLRIRTKVIVGVDKPGQNLILKEYTPKVIDYEGGDFDAETGLYNFKDLDWALLKIDGTNFPTLPLGDSDKLSIGSQVIVVGYPFVSEEYSESEEYYDFKTNIEPTLTTGYISQVTTVEKNQYFQVDLSISEGNSGGPALDNNGNVIGIATWGLGEYTGGHYNYLLRINDIKQRIADDVQAMQGEVDQLWNEGLESYWAGSYSESKEKFDGVLSLSPNHPYVKNILSDVNKKVGTEKAKEPQLETPSGTKDYGFSPAMIVLIVVGLGIIGLLIFMLVRKRK